jgi:hypothetical protein
MIENDETVVNTATYPQTHSTCAHPQSLKKSTFSTNIPPECVQPIKLENTYQHIHLKSTKNKL